MPVFIAIGAAIAAAHHYSKQRDNEAPLIDPSLLHGLTPIDLLPSEERFIDEQPIRTISLYEGSSSDAAAILWDRLNELVEKNPWLCGCIAKGGGKEIDASADNTPIRIWYDESANTIQPAMFQYHPRGLVQLNRTTPYANLESALASFDVYVKPNRDILNKTQEALFKVSIVPEDTISESSPVGFALVVSMSSVLGDAYTFFKLYNMLIGSTTVAQLQPMRVNRFDEDMSKLMGPNEAEYVSHITSDPSWEKFFIHDELRSSGHLQGRLFEVSGDWISDVMKSKLRHEQSTSKQQLLYNSLKSPMDQLVIKDCHGCVVKRVSTSDIIVSWFWNLVRPTVGLLEVNLREHVEVVNANHAGNYSNSIAYTPDDYKTAESIQNSQSTFCRVGKCFDPPTVLPRVRVTTRFSIVTNHLSYSKAERKENEAHFEEKSLLNDKRFKLIRHAPLYFISELKGVLPKRMSFLDLFQLGQDKIGCFIVAPADAMSKIDTCGIVDNTIFKF
jgi:hypothetical protein